MVSLRTKGLQEVIDKIARIGDEIPDNVNDWMQDEGIRLMGEFVGERFISESDGTEPWMPLSEVTIKFRVEEGYGPGPILFKTGSLLNSLLGRENKDVKKEGARGVLGAYLPDNKARILHFGGRNEKGFEVPSRKFLTFAPGDKNRVIKSFGEYLVNHMK